MKRANRICNRIAKDAILFNFVWKKGSISKEINMQLEFMQCASCWWWGQARLFKVAKAEQAAKYHIQIRLGTVSFIVELFAGEWINTHKSYWHSSSYTICINNTQLWMLSSVVSMTIHNEQYHRKTKIPCQCVFDPFSLPLFRSIQS